MIRKRILAWTFILLASWLVQGCFSFRLSTKDSSIPIEEGTVSVQYFQNMARIIEPSLSQDFTDGLKDYIQANVSRKITMVNGTGDLDFEGSITGYEVKPVAITSEQASQNRFTITVNVRYTCSVKEDLDFEASFSRYEDFASTENFEDVKADLTDKIVKLLIEDVFNKAFVNW
jgi:hypothetical protein